MFEFGLGLFTLASLLAALAPSGLVLIAVRAVQGGAAALVVPQTYGLITTMFDGDDRSRALGAIGPVMGAAGVAGPLLGALLTRADLLGAGWRPVFLVNLPLGVAALLLARSLPPDTAPSTDSDRPRLDPTGTLLAGLGIALLVYPLIEGPAAGWPVWVWLALGAGVLVLAGFAVQQRAGRHPLVERSLFRDRAFPSALAASTGFFAAFTGLTLVAAMYLQLTLHRGILWAGLGLLPWSAALAAASWLGGSHLVPRFGAAVMAAGLLLLLIAVLAAVPAVLAGSVGWPLAALALGGVGAGLYTVSFFSAVLARVRPPEAGSVAGLLNAVQQLGATIGVAALGGVFLDSGMVAALLLAAALLLVTAVPTVLLRPR